MRVITEPTVAVVARTTFDREAMQPYPHPRTVGGSPGDGLPDQHPAPITTTEERTWPLSYAAANASES
jgi:hypothetical protein